MTYVHGGQQRADVPPLLVVRRPGLFRCCTVSMRYAGIYKYMHMYSICIRVNIVKNCANVACEVTCRPGQVVVSYQQLLVVRSARHVEVILLLLGPAVLLQK